MIRCVYEQASKCSRLQKVVVATDDERIFDHVKNFGGAVTMTSFTHKSGTDRCHDALQQQPEKWDVVINIQGDEPFIRPEQIEMLTEMFLSHDTDIATLARKMDTQEDLYNANRVKVVLGEQGKALYFSRHAIPYQKGIPKNQWLNRHAYFSHIGIYGYRTKVLQTISQLFPSVLEKAESLEQLRWLENGFLIRVGLTPWESVGIDTPEDLERVKRSFL